MRAADGTITMFDVPGAIYGTAAYSINGAGAITGGYYCASGMARGFVWTPQEGITGNRMPPGISERLSFASRRGCATN